MQQFKRAQVVMLPTENESQLFIGNIDKGMQLLLGIPIVHKNHNNQHLYIISDDEIKKDDWVYKSDANPNIFKWITTTNAWYNDCKKIIATTDTSLKVSKPFNSSWGELGHSSVSLPQPSRQFIEKYVEEYNKGNIITDIEVEYIITDGEYFDSNFIPKINSKNNTITIKKLKDNWNREELISKFKQFKKDIINNIDLDDDFETLNCSLNEDKWIEENL